MNDLSATIDSQGLTISPLRQTRDRERREQTRRRLLDSAITVFSRQGYHNTLVSDIVAEAGVGQGTFYRNFESKRAIFETLFDQIVEDLFAQVSALGGAMPTNATEYRASSVEALTRLARTCEQHRSVLMPLLRDGPTVDAAFASKFERMYDGFAQIAGFYLEHAIEHGFARPCDTHMVGQALLGIGMRIVALWIRGDIPAERIDVMVREVVDLAFFGFGPSAPATAG